MQDRFEVAIIGIGCRFARAHGPAQLWRLVCAGEDAISEVPRERFDVDPLYDPRPGTFQFPYTPRLTTGAPMTCDLFPRVWPNR